MDRFVAESKQLLGFPPGSTVGIIRRTMKPTAHSFTVNGRTYTPPAQPVAVLCLDGSADAYLDAAMARGLMPHTQRLAVQGWRGSARAAMPTFTNVNNSSIVTGVPPSVHGIGGNFFYDTSIGQEVMMNSSSFLRVPTLFPAAQSAGRKVAVVTAKEKLRDIFASGLISKGGIAFSSEKARDAALATHGIEGVESLSGPTPAIYSGDASLYVLRAGVQLLQAGRADFLYLSTTDFMQHKYVPDAPEALAFYASIDAEIGQLLSLGAVVGITADHGMNFQAAGRRDTQRGVSGVGTQRALGRRLPGHPADHGPLRRPSRSLRFLRSSPPADRPVGLFGRGPRLRCDPARDYRSAASRPSRSTDGAARRPHGRLGRLLWPRCGHWSNPRLPRSEGHRGRSPLARRAIRRTRPLYPQPSAAF